MVFEIMALLTMQLLQVNITGNGTNYPIELPVITLENAFGDLTSTLILITLMIAITLRTSSEFIEKMMKGEIDGFNRKYLFTAVVAFISSIPLAMALFGESAKIFLAYFGSWGLVGALFMVGVYGYGWNHLVNKLTSLAGHFYTAKSGEGGSIQGEQSQPQGGNPPV